MERAGRVDFFEVWIGEDTFLADIGVYGDEVNHEAEAQRIAKLMSPDAVAHFDRTGDVYIP